MKQIWPGVEENNKWSGVWNLSVWAVTCTPPQTNTPFTDRPDVCYYIKRQRCQGTRLFAICGQKMDCKNSPGCQICPNKTRQAASEHSLLVRSSTFSLSLSLARPISISIHLYLKTIAVHSNNPTHKLPLCNTAAGKQRRPCSPGVSSF